MNTQDMIAALEQMLATLKGANPPAEPAAPAYPREAVIAGAHFTLRAPVHEAWVPSQYARIFGKGHMLPDPSNAPVGAALRSPAGFPLYYPTADQPPMLLQGDMTFATDAGALEYIAAVAASQAGSLQRDKDQGYEFKVPGETEVRVEQG